MAKRMNEANKEQKIKNLQVNGSTLENNEDKVEAFAKCFSDISSNKNYSSSFLTCKNNIEFNHKNLFVNTVKSTDNEAIQNLNEPFTFHELRRALRDNKKHSAPGEDKITYEMFQNYRNVQIKTVLKFFNQI